MRSETNPLGGVALGALLLAGLSLVSADHADASQSPPAATAGPVEVVQETSHALIHALDKNQAKLKRNPEFANKLVREYLLPHFDLKFTSKLVLGRYWRIASPKQRKAFTRAFLHYLIHTYATGLKHYNGASVKVLPFRGNKKKQYVTVRTRVDAPDHNPASVDYVLHKTPHGWEAFDVKIGGISYVQTYRNEFQTEIRRTSLHALIQRLQHAKAPKSLTAAKSAPGGE